VSVSELNKSFLLLFFKKEALSYVIQYCAVALMKQAVLF
jgi:hypothetical protein